MAAPAEWGASEWLEWLRRGPGDPAPHRSGLNDCADALQAEIERLQSELARKAL